MFRCQRLYKREDRFCIFCQSYSFGLDFNRIMPIEHIHDFCNVLHLESLAEFFAAHGKISCNARCNIATGVMISIPLKGSAQ